MISQNKQAIGATSLKALQKRSNNPITVKSSGVIAIMRNVTMTYNGWQTRSLNNFDIEIRQGEVFTLLGPRGSGKSTALKILAGRLRPTEGKVKVFGRSPRTTKAKTRIGYLPQRVGDERPGGFAGIVSFVKELILGREPARPAQQSEKSQQKGQRRQKLAHAILGNRDLVILDEPFSDLNADDCHELKEMILMLAWRGKTIVMSSDSRPRPRTFAVAQRFL